MFIKIQHSWGIAVSKIGKMFLKTKIASQIIISYPSFRIKEHPSVTILRSQQTAIAVTIQPPTVCRGLSVRESGLPQGSAVLLQRFPDAAFGIDYRSFSDPSKRDLSGVSQGLQGSRGYMQVFADLVRRQIAFPSDLRAVVLFRRPQGAFCLLDAGPKVFHLVALRRQILQSHYFTPFRTVRASM